MKKLTFIFLLTMFLASCNKQPRAKKVQEKSKKENTIDFSKYTFNSLTAKNQKIKLEKGKKYLLDFWFIECPPCVRDHKTIQKKLTKLTKKNIEIIGISIDRSAKKWKEYLLQHNYNWQQYNQYFEEPKLRKDLKIKLYPRYFLINDNGVIQKQTGSLAKILDYLRIQ